LCLCCSQGDIEKVASRSPEQLTQLFEQISGSDALAKPYEVRLYKSSVRVGHVGYRYSEAAAADMQQPHGSLQPLCNAVLVLLKS